MPKSSTFKTVIVFFLLSATLIGCRDQKYSEPTDTPFPQNPPLPHFLRRVYPPSGEFGIEFYRNSLLSEIQWPRGVSISGWADRMGMQEENLEWEIVSQRASLLVDGTLVSRDYFVGRRFGELGSFLFEMTWAIPLKMGEHTFSFLFESDTGEVLRYTWQVILIEE